MFRWRPQRLQRVQLNSWTGQTIDSVYNIIVVCSTATARATLFSHTMLSTATHHCPRASTHNFGTYARVVGKTSTVLLSKKTPGLAI